ncbi:unnamed protein product [Dicrocoelium dendriticum]|nr:unnamed protein product [Dicrocoelium dendriticum]
MVERKARSATLKATLFSRLLCNDSIPCLVILTESQLLWKPEVVTLSYELTQINLCDIVFVRTFSQLRFGVTNAKRFKLLQSILHQIGDNVKVHGFVVSSLVRTAKYKWRTRQDIFWCDSGDDAELWTSTLNKCIFTPDTTRPRRLLVFVNPNAGRKRAERKYNSIVLPLFHLSGIETHTVVTSYRGHMMEYLINCSMEGFDGVVCVGGDGFLSEAMHGLLLRRRLECNLPLYDGHLPGSSELPGNSRIGIIPAGSTDTVAYSTLGTNDVMTSVLHIVLGDDLPLDVAAIHSNEDGAFLRYALSMVGCGFYADLLKNDDSRRWMGPRRYDCSGFAKFLSHTVYEGRISFLPSANRSSHISDGVTCTRGCPVCTLDIDSILGRRHSNLVNSHYALTHSVDCLYPVTRENKELSASRILYSTARHRSAGSFVSGPGSSWCPVKPTTKLPLRYQPNASCLDQCTRSAPKYTSADRLTSSRDSRTRFGRQKASLCGSSFVSNSKQICPPSLKLLPFFREVTSDNAPSWCLQGCSEGWQTINDRFIAVSAFVQSCRCSKSPMGPSPCAHLGDGCMDLILISKCTRKQFLQYLIRVANGSVPEQDPNFKGRQKRGAFDLPFVTALRVCAFEFHPDQSLSLDFDGGVPNEWTIPLDDRNGFVENTKLLHPASHKSRSCIQGRCRNSQRTHRTVWCSDGEIVQHSDISVFVHRQLIRVFARGLVPLNIVAVPPSPDVYETALLFDSLAAILNDPAPCAERMSHEIVPTIRT